MPESTPYFRLAINGYIAELFLDRPGQRNSLCLDFWHELPKLLDEIDSNPDIRVLILAGNGKHFCSGIDLKFAERLLKPDTEDISRANDAISDDIQRLQRVMLKLERLRVPVIAAIHGACIGAGLELACTTDIRLCSENAFFQLMEVQLALVADLGGLQRLCRQIPQGLALELAYTGRRIDSREAHNCGLVNTVFSDQETLLNEARKLATQIANNSPLTVKHIKETLITEESFKLELELRKAATLQVAYGLGGDFSQTVAAKKNKQTIHYQALHSSSLLD